MDSLIQAGCRAIPLQATATQPKPQQLLRAPALPVVLRPLHFYVSGIAVNQAAADINAWLEGKRYRNQFVGSTCSWRMWVAKYTGGHEMTVEINIYSTGTEGELVVEVQGVDQYVDRFFVGELFWEVRRAVLHLTAEQDQVTMDPDMDFGDIDETKIVLENVSMKVGCGMTISNLDQDVLKSVVEEGRWEDYREDLEAITSKAMDVFCAPARNGQRLTLKVCQEALVVLGLLCTTEKARRRVIAHASFVVILRAYREEIKNRDIIKVMRADKILKAMGMLNSTEGFGASV